MFKTILTITATVLGVLFTIQNFDHVQVYFISGKALNIRLIFVIAISGLVGYLIRHFYGISREEKLKKDIRHLLRIKKNDRNRGNKASDSKKALWIDDVDEDEI